MSHKIVSSVWFISLILFALPISAQNNVSEALPEGEGKHLVEFVCVQCHGLNQITRSPGYNIHN